MDWVDTVCDFEQNELPPLHYRYWDEVPNGVAQIVFEVDRIQPWN